MKSQLLAIVTYVDRSAFRHTDAPQQVHIYGPHQYLPEEKMNQLDVSEYAYTLVNGVQSVQYTQAFYQLPMNREAMKAEDFGTEKIPATTDYIPHSQIAQVKSGNLPFKIWIVLNSGVIYYTDRFVVVPGKGIEGDFELLEQPSTGEVKQAEARIVEVKADYMRGTLTNCYDINGIKCWVNSETGLGYKAFEDFTTLIPNTYFKIVDHFTPQSPSKENGYNRGLHGGDERAYAGNLGQSALVVKAKRTDLYRDGGTAVYQGTDNNTYYVWRPTGAVYRDHKHLIHLPDVIIQDIDDNTQYTWDGRHSLYHVPVQKSKTSSFTPEEQLLLDFIEFNNQDKYRNVARIHMIREFIASRVAAEIKEIERTELSDEAKCPYSRGEVLRVQGWKGLYVVNRIRKNEVFVLRLHEDGTLAKHTEAVPWPNLTIVPTRLFYYFEADTSTGFSTDDPNHDAALIAAHG